MKTYRACVADAYVLQEILSMIAERADRLRDDAFDYRKKFEEADDSPQWYLDSADECEAKAAAYERFLTKLVK